MFRPNICDCSHVAEARAQLERVRDWRIETSQKGTQLNMPSGEGDDDPVLTCRSPPDDAAQDSGGSIRDPSCSGSDSVEEGEEGKESSEDDGSMKSFAVDGHDPSSEAVGRAAEDRATVITVLGEEADGYSPEELTLLAALDYEYTCWNLDYDHSTAWSSFGRFSANDLFASAMAQSSFLTNPDYASLTLTAKDALSWHCDQAQRFIQTEITRAAVLAHVYNRQRQAGQQAGLWI